jgi:L-lactate dehydrogenase complex protein LldE
MQVALMISCYIDLFYLEVGVATLELLEKLKVDVVYPFDQTCCAQPMANSGCYEEAQATEELFIRNFSAFDHIVTPSGSCTHHLRNKFTAAPDSPERRKVSASVYDLVEFCTTFCRFATSLGRSSNTKWLCTRAVQQSAASAWLQ